jgi:hypothetical protein
MAKVTRNMVMATMMIATKATIEITTGKSCATGMAATRAICLPDWPREIACLQD